jgi:integrase
VRHQLGRDGKRRPLKTAAARRDVILMSQLANELRKWRLASPYSSDGDLVFCSTAGKTIGHRNLTARGLEKAAKRPGLKGVTFHVLRHTFASILIAKGHDLAFVYRRLGHANAAITPKVYAHLFDAERHAAEARQGLEDDYGALFAASIEVGGKSSARFARGRTQGPQPCRALAGLYVATAKP